jgi:hypothetical protein
MKFPWLAFEAIKLSVPRHLRETPPRPTITLVSPAFLASQRLPKCMDTTSRIMDSSFLSKMVQMILMGENF